MNHHTGKNITFELGKILAQKRLEASLSIELVRNRLMLSEQQLIGLETNNFNSFYNRNLYLKSMGKYAALLNYDGPLIKELQQLIRDEVTSRVEQEINSSLANNERGVVSVRRNYDKYVVLAAVLLALVLVLIGVNELRS